MALLSLVVRAPLALLPGPGRDEAAYYYWAQHAEAGYAPLLLAAVRILDELGLPALAAIRLPSLVGGVVCLALFDMLLKTTGVGTRGRLLALLTLALNPWQVLVGSLLHPDTLFLAALLALALALRSRRPGWAAVTAAAAALAKPTGIVLLPVVAIWLWHTRSFTGRRRLVASGLLVILALPAVAWLSPSMLREILEFGRLDPSLSPGRRLAIALGSLMVEGGLLLPLAAGQGLGEGIRRWRRKSLGEDAPGFVLALTLILLFAGGAVLNGQVKGSWFLPAFVLLWPSRPLALPRPAIPVLLLISALASVVMVGAMKNPAVSARLETRWGLNELYGQRAGTREERVSSTRTFSERFREFEDLGAVAEEALQHWRKATGEQAPPPWIVSDDYGLAAQLAYQWRSHRPRLLIPEDGLFNHGEEAAAQSHASDVLVVAVRTPVTGIWPPWGPVAEIGTLPHPVTDDRVTLGVASRAMGPATGDAPGTH